MYLDILGPVDSNTEYELIKIFANRGIICDFSEFEIQFALRLKGKNMFRRKWSWQNFYIN
ncbi:hypothetical protein HMPREF2825_00360 [Staphylococcus sp. HMSC068H12]|nr:hypothetical protein ASS78_00575 [Staphylococcus saprophyticus]OEK23815.1 hypothetical protein ASS82_12325 [Staphylococcus saprophyticus]OEK23917.1 hypothetical protein ASS81_12085 [Staphylococcus saprophyticus]OFK23127.1 hypothetical protein HMPREF2825_00360 [Staphylococcus sp. HMSC068H12]